MEVVCPQFSSQQLTVLRIQLIEHCQLLATTAVMCCQVHSLQQRQKDAISLLVSVLRDADAS